MSYVSPFELLGLDASAGAADRNALHLARKRLLAEFELAGNAPTVQVNGQEFTKTDLLQLLDTLQDPAVLQFHLVVHRDPLLLSFLKLGQIPPGGRLAHEPLYGDRAFIAFLSPHFAASYDKALDAAFRKRNLRVLRSLAALPLLVEAAQEEDCFRSVRRELQKLIGEIDRIFENAWERKFQPRDTEFYANSALLGAVNELPARLQSLRDAYASKLLDLAIHIWNEHYGNDLAQELIGRVMGMRVDAGVLRRSRELLAQMRTAAPPPPRPSASYSPPAPAPERSDNTWKIVVILLKVLLLIAYISSRNCSRSSPDYYPAVNSHFIAKLNEKQKYNNPAGRVAAAYVSYLEQQASDTLPAGKKKKKKKKQPPEIRLASGHELHTPCFDDINTLSLGFRLLVINSTDEDVLLLLGDEHSAAGKAFVVAARGRHSYDSLMLMNPLVYAYAGRGWNDSAQVGYVPVYEEATETVFNVPLSGAFRKPCANAAELLQRFRLRPLSRLYQGNRDPNGKYTQLLLIQSDPDGCLKLHNEVMPGYHTLPSKVKEGAAENLPTGH